MAKTTIQITSEERNRMLGRLGYGVDSAIKAQDALARSFTIDGQFRLYLSNAEEAFGDVKQWFEDLLNAQTKPPKEKA